MLDEADKLLDMDFEQEIDQILKVRVGLATVPSKHLETMSRTHLLVVWAEASTV